jgi:hypothetical protein
LAKSIFEHIRAGVAQSIEGLGYGLDDWGSIPGRAMEGIILFTTITKVALGAHTSLLSTGY